MSKLSNFLHLKIYRQTFLLYLVIVLTFVTIMIFVFYSNMQSSTMEPYVREAEAAFSQVERQLDSITDSIDHFFTHLYATPPSGTTSSTFSGPPRKNMPRAG